MRIASGCLLGLLLGTAGVVALSASGGLANAQTPDTQAAPPSFAVPGADSSVPRVLYFSGDVITPLEKGLPLPPKDPRNFEGNWASLGHPTNVDGGPAPYQPAIQAEMARLKQLDVAGAPEVRKNTLCRPNGPFAVSGNQFPTQILQRREKMLFIAEEGRTIWDIDLSGPPSSDAAPAYGGHSLGHWEGDTLVIESKGHKARLPTSFLAGNTDKLRLISKITRQNTGDPLNGERLVIYQTIDDPGTYTKPWTAVSVARWRPDMQVLEFNCEESSDDEVNRGLTVK